MTRQKRFLFWVFGMVLGSDRILEKKATVRFEHDSAFRIPTAKLAAMD
jgi:hypothetical protein